MKDYTLTPNEAVQTVLRSYDGVMLQGYDHDKAVEFTAKKFKVDPTTVLTALALRDDTEGPVTRSAGQQTYGLEIEASPYRSHRDLVGAIDNTPSGNVAIRIGTENVIGGSQGWHQTGYIVLTPIEAEALANTLLAAAVRA